VANITLAIDDQLLKEARKIAIERDTTVNQMVREFLESQVISHPKRRTAARNLLSRRYPASPITWRREDLYDR
jgi:hypothetical protein